MTEKMKVLLVDDEAEFVTTLAERLRLRDIEAISTTDGMEALAQVRDIQPQVVVLDLMMPGISGLDVLRQIRIDHPDIPVILLTGRGGTKEGMEGMNLGAYDFLMKPVKIEELISVMTNALQGPRSGT